MADAAVMVPQATTAQLIRQAGIMVAIAASVALGVYVVLWARTPNYTVLFSSLGDRDVAAVMDTLQLENSIARSRALAYLSQVALKMLEVGELEERLKALEMTVGPKKSRLK